MKKFLVLVSIALFLGGCVKTKCLSVERVDQQIYGNAGYVQGNPPKEVKCSKGKKYRKILEIDVSSITDSEERQEYLCSKKK